jgi:hypothetical protein
MLPHAAHLDDFASLGRRAADFCCGRGVLSMIADVWVLSECTESDDYPLAPAFDKLRSDGGVWDGSRLRLAAKTCDGFDIVIQSDRKGYIVSFGGLHHETTSAREVIFLTRLARTSDCRLRVEYVNDRPFNWTLELHSDAWKPILSAGYVRLWPFGRKRTSYHYSSAAP